MTADLPRSPVTVIVFRVGCPAVLQTFPADEQGGHLSSMQRCVGGLVELVRLPDGCDLWCNEEGLLLDLPVNRTIGSRRGKFTIHGDFFISRRTLDGELASVSDADFRRYRDLDQGAFS